jgi:hypothetical protein
MSNSPRIPEGALVYPALSIPWRFSELDVDYPEYDLVKAEMEERARGMLAGWELPPDAQMTRPIGEPFLSPCQLAVGYIALGDVEQAIPLLAQDFDRHHPLLVWLHLWPLLDPLREHPTFRRLLHRMHLPSIKH